MITGLVDVLALSSLVLSGAALGLAANWHVRRLRVVSKRSCGYYSIGSPRHAENEDYGACIEVPYWAGGRLDKAVVAAVADGVSGGGWGRYAAYTAVTMVVGGLASWLSEVLGSRALEGCPEPGVEEVNRVLERLYLNVDDVLKSRLQHMAQQGRYAASTLSVAMVLCGRLYTGHVGDTRIYLLAREGREYRLHRLTTDHAEGNRLTNFVGSIPAPTGAPRVDVMDEPVYLEELGNPLILLLSDGVYKCLGSSDDELKEWLIDAIREARDPQNLARRLVEEARSRMNMRVCNDDDATAVVVKP